MSDKITRSHVRSDFAYMRELMRIADKMMRDRNTDLSLGGEFEQLSLELIGAAHTLNAWITEERARQVSNRVIADLDRANDERLVRAWGRMGDDA